MDIMEAVSYDCIYYPLFNHCMPSIEEWRMSIPKPSSICPAAWKAADEGTNPIIGIYCSLYCRYCYWSALR